MFLVYTRGDWLVVRWQHYHPLLWIGKKKTIKPGHVLIFEQEMLTLISFVGTENDCILHPFSYNTDPSSRSFLLKTGVISVDLYAVVSLIYMILT